jgi:deoxyhypusine synthase
MSRREKKKDCYMAGKMIEPLKLKGNENVASFIRNVFGNSGFNARRLAEACEIYSKMLQENTTVCLTLAGAMTPIGMSGPIIDMMELGFIDFIISTGANLYHDLHRPFDYPVRQGSSFVNDAELYQLGIARIYDTFIEDDETLLATDRIILETVKQIPSDKPISTAEFHHFLGQRVQEIAPHPEKSLLAQAARLNVPIYTSSPGDSSIGMNLAGAATFGKRIIIDSTRDILETAAIVKSAAKNGAIEIGGGSPKNFYMQTQPMLSQIMYIEKGGHDYFIQITTDAPHWGGLSGATPSEAVSWKKINPKMMKNDVVVYCDTTIAAPLLFSYVLSKQHKRKLKRLYTKRENYLEKMKDTYNK